jgi:hypothetical protein
VYRTFGLYDTSKNRNQGVMVVARRLSHIGPLLPDRGGGGARFPHRLSGICGERNARFRRQALFFSAPAYIKLTGVFVRASLMLASGSKSSHG